VRYLADYHEQAVFSAPDSDGIGNIAGQTILPPILSALQSIANASEPLKLQYIGVAYKPVSFSSDVVYGRESSRERSGQFISLFNMTEAHIDGMVSYTSVVAIEVRNNTNSGLTVTFNLCVDGSDSFSDGNRSAD
jgi:prostatic aicd phosphatase